MTPLKLRAAIIVLNTTQVGLAEDLGISGRAVRRYLAGKTIPQPIAKLIRMALHGKITLADIRDA